MSISFKEAFSFPFVDENWKTKIGIGILFYLPLVFVQEKSIWAALFTLVASMFVCGYYYLTLNKLLNTDKEELADWDYKRIVPVVSKAFLVSLGYFIILLPVYGIMFGLFLLLKSSSWFFILLGILILLIFGVLYMPVAHTLFCVNFELSEAFNFSKIFNIAKVSYKIYLKAIFYMIIICFIYGFGFGFVGGVISIFSKSIGTFIMQTANIFTYIISAYLYSKAYKDAIKNI